MVIAGVETPMQGICYQPIEVINNSGEAIEVTPVGLHGGLPNGERAHLDIPADGPGRLAASRLGGFPLRDGESVKFIHDYDDIGFSEIAVKTAAGKFLQLAVDPHGDGMGAAPQNRYVIPPLDQLEPATPAVIAVASGPHETSRPWIMMGLFLLPLAVLPAALLWRARLGKADGGNSRLRG